MAACSTTPIKSGKKIYAYDYDPGSGAITDRRVFVDSDREPGAPDGLVVDSEGCLRSARWDGWKILRYDPAGLKMFEVSLPVARPTICAFGGEDRKSLYITSASHGLSSGHLRHHPLSGDLFCIHAGAGGQEEYLFAG